MTDTIPDVVPNNEYEITDGTPAVAHGTHEPRTLVRTTTTGDDTSVYMMTEISDGVFVQWSQCAGCSNGVATCKCKDGPQEPGYITKWRDDRFARSLDTRPDIDFEALPSVVKHLKAQGYTVLSKTEIAEYRAAVLLAEQEKPEPEADKDCDTDE